MLDTACCVGVEQMKIKLMRHSGPQLEIAKNNLEFLFENLWVESQDSRAFSAST